MIELITEILIYLGIAALLGLVLGYLIWGWGTAARISAARADGAAAARTSVDGNAGLREQLQASEVAREKLEDEVDRLTEALAACERKQAQAAVPEPSGPAPLGPEPIAEIASPASIDPPLAEVSEGTSYAAGTEVEAEPDADAVSDALPAAPALPEGLLEERPEEVDDLKRIKGVGKVMEGVLNDKGIYLFRQLARLSEQEVAWVNDAIDAFPGRIHRDRWVEQAAELYAEKYGEAHDQAS